jgi:hypothetical protein
MSNLQLGRPLPALASVLLSRTCRLFAFRTLIGCFFNGIIVMSHFRVDVKFFVCKSCSYLPMCPFLLKYIRVIESYIHVIKSFTALKTHSYRLPKILKAKVVCT